MWRNATEKEKKAYMEHEARLREKYKTSIAQWREEQAKKEEEVRRLEAEKIHDSDRRTTTTARGPDGKGCSAIIC
jgi:hypothetical protein